MSRGGMNRLIISVGQLNSYWEKLYIFWYPKQWPYWSDKYLQGNQPKPNLLHIYRLLAHKCHDMTSKSMSDLILSTSSSSHTRKRKFWPTHIVGDLISILMLTYNVEEQPSIVGLGNLLPVSVDSTSRQFESATLMQKYTGIWFCYLFSNLWTS